MNDDFEFQSAEPRGFKVFYAVLCPFVIFIKFEKNAIQFIIFFHKTNKIILYIITFI